MNTNMERAMNYYNKAGNTMVEGGSEVIDCVVNAGKNWLMYKINEAYGIMNAVSHTAVAAGYFAKGTAIVAKEAGKYGVDKTKKFITETAEYRGCANK